ncbi:hypothetical protein H0H93_005606 [Arthromyces matolae]|nr:hypothetical protein H0H93_005606 [Arthromyces matolae]
MGPFTKHQHKKDDFKTPRASLAVPLLKLKLLMRFYTVLLAALAAVLPCAALLAPVYDPNFAYPSNRYIVKLKPGANISSVCEATNTNTIYEYKVIHGFAATLDANQLKALRSDPNVEYVKQDIIGNATALVSQHDAPWGLARLSTGDQLVDQNPNDLNFTYIYDSSGGEGVDTYILGVYTEHEEFESGRAILGPNFVPFVSNEDIYGHGTHCAGIVAGRRFGVAKNANIISVKVLDDHGNGWDSDVIAGLDYVYTSASLGGRPSIASMSFSLSGPSAPLDEAVAFLTASGIHVVVSAGDGFTDVFTISPGRAPTAIAVGSIDITDTRPDLSRPGCLVDIHAPGVNIISAAVGCPDALTIRSGTSMAAAHVSGLIASLISLDGNISPADMKEKLKGLAIHGAISNILIGTANLLAQNGLAAA